MKKEQKTTRTKWNDPEETRDFYDVIDEISSLPEAQQMKQYMQHGSVTTYDHCMNVAMLSFRLNRSLHIHGREKELLRGAFLHDYFLYDWHDWDGSLHGFHHAGTALRNAKRDFDLSEREENIIGSHMWPLNLTRIPRCREAWIVCLADKIVSTRETLFNRH